jgi:hypothetical protein
MEKNKLSTHRRSKFEKTIKNNILYRTYSFLKPVFESLVFGAIFPRIFDKNKKLDDRSTLNMPVNVSNQLSGEVVGGGVVGL